MRPLLWLPYTPAPPHASLPRLAWVCLGRTHSLTRPSLPSLHFPPTRPHPSPPPVCRCAEIFLKSSGQVVGLFGTVHPEVLGHFDLPYPTSAAEIDLQAFL